MTSSKIAYPPENFCIFNSLILLLVHSDVHFSTTCMRPPIGKVHHHLTGVKFRQNTLSAKGIHVSAFQCPHVIGVIVVVCVYENLILVI